jgi:hypothetical protein
VSRNGLSLQWASYNLPTSLQASMGGTTYSSQFLYGPNHQRYQQNATYSSGTEVTSYAGGLFEKVTGSDMGGITAYRHYVLTPGGSTLVIARNSDGTSTTTYALSDHLGSSDAMVNGTSGSAGNLLVQESFGAFGQRRSSNWTAAGPSVFPTVMPEAGDYYGNVENGRRMFAMILSAQLTGKLISLVYSDQDGPACRIASVKVQW